MTARLASFAADQWSEIDGELQLAGVDLLKLPFDRAINVLYHMVMRNRDEKERAKVETHLTKPMVGEHIPEDDASWGEEAQGSAFLAAMQATEMDKKKTTEGGED